MASEPYTSRHKPAPLHESRPYRPRAFNQLSRSRFERQRWGELTRHLGRPPAFPERILITRIIADEWDLLRTDAQRSQGLELSWFDARLRNAAESRLRRDLVVLGLTEPKDPAGMYTGQAKPDPLEVIRQHIAARRGSGGRAA